MFPLFACCVPSLHLYPFFSFVCIIFFIVLYLSLLPQYKICSVFIPFLYSTTHPLNFTDSYTLCTSLLHFPFPFYTFSSLLTHFYLFCTIDHFLTLFLLQPLTLLKKLFPPLHLYEINALFASVSSLAQLPSFPLFNPYSSLLYNYPPTFFSPSLNLYLGTFSPSLFFPSISFSIGTYIPLIVSFQLIFTLFNSPSYSNILIFLLTYFEPFPIFEPLPSSPIVTIASLLLPYYNTNEPSLTLLPYLVVFLPQLSNFPPLSQIFFLFVARLAPKNISPFKAFPPFAGLMPSLYIFLLVPSSNHLLPLCILVH